MAPSPTGFFHVGSLRTALYCYLYAHSHGGKYLIRIEDTDKIRSKKEYEDDILDSLEWLGLKHDLFFRQSEHLADHKKYLEQLLDGGHAYVSKEEAKDEHAKGEVREVIRFKNPNETVTFNDLVLGEISVDTTDLGDFVIAKDFDTPLYNFAVVVDDIAANITHVIRGQDHVPNTPRQILLYRALGKTPPAFAHLPLIVAPDKSKLSKRKHGESVSVRFYRKQGYLPEALINFMALIGWNPGTDQEIFSLEELVKTFTLERVQKSPGVFNLDKLNWLNKEYIRKMDPAARWEKILEYVPAVFTDAPWFNQNIFNKLQSLIGERIEKFSDVTTMIEAGEIDFFFKKPALVGEKISFKGSTADETKAHLAKAQQILTDISDSDWNVEYIKGKIMEYADSLPKRGPALHPLRYGLSGLEKSPDPFTIASIIGKQETLERIEDTLRYFGT